jgi:hypothetical protein
MSDSICTVEEYRKNIGKTFKVKVPSGMFFEVKRLTPMDYFQNGLNDIPNGYFRFISEINNSEKVTDDEIKESYNLFQQFFKITIEKGILNPPTFLSFEDNKIDINKVKKNLLFGELSTKDQEYLVAVITGKINIE